jgi:peptidoglycan/LPS O-acetylase OafA/YrhL
MGTIRFLLALSVVVAHSPSGTGTLLGVHLLPAFTAVQAFYIISGFLITMVLNERKEYQIARNFYLSRYLRLWPCYMVVAALAFVLFRSNTFVADLSKNDFSTTVFVVFSNLTMFFQDWFLFLEIDIDNGALVPTTNFNAGPTPQLNAFLLVPQAWTLGVELTFYLLAPLLCRRPMGAAALFLGGLSVRLVIGAWQPNMDPWMYRFAPAEMMLFAAGALSYFGGRYVNARFKWSTLKLWPVLWLAIIAIAIVDVPYITKFMRSFVGNKYFSSLMLWYPGFLLLVAAACPSLFYGWRNVRWDGVLGELSYPIYISHMFVLEGLWRVISDGVPNKNLYVASVVVFSAALLVLVVLPFDKLRARFGGRVPIVVQGQPNAHQRRRGARNLKTQGI